MNTRKAHNEPTPSLYHPLTYHKENLGGVIAGEHEGLADIFVKDLRVVGGPKHPDKLAEHLEVKGGSTRKTQQRGRVLQTKQ